MLNGTLDPQTPLVVSQPLAANIALDNVVEVVVPYAAHGVIVQSPTAEGPCGLRLMYAWMNAPGEPLDLTCVDQVPAPDFFDGAAAIAAPVFGSNDAWDGGLSLPTSLPPPLPSPAPISP